MTSAANTGNAIERLRAEHKCPVDDFGDPLPDCRGCADLAAVDALYQAAKELLHEYEGEETEHGFPFNFALRDAHRSLAAAVRRVEGE